MKRLLISLTLLCCISLISHAQSGDGCCPDYNANLTVVDCSVEVCLTSTFAKKQCPNASFFVQIHNQNGDLVFSGVPGGPCFTFTDAVPGETYTVSGSVYPDPTPLECNPPAQIIPASVTVPEDCSCCPTLTLSADVNACDMIVCWEIENPDVEYCPEGTTIQLYFERTDGPQIEIFEFGPGDDCITWSNAIPGASYAIGIRVLNDFNCHDGDGVVINATMPEDCGCCPDLTSTVEFDGCDAIICVQPLNPDEDFCEDGFNSIAAFVRNEEGTVVDVVSFSGDNCFTWSEGEPGQSYTVSGRIDYEYDCDEGETDLLPVVFTIPEDCSGCAAPTNIECHPLNQDISITWDGSANAVEYFVEIRSHVENVACCEPHTNIEVRTLTTTEPSIESMKVVAPFNCLVMRITTICADGSSETTDWMCFSYGYWGCPGDIQDDENGDLALRNNSEIVDEIIAYPNPVTDMLNLKGENLRIGHSVSIYSVEGELISRDFISRKNLFTKDISRIIPGKYIAKISSPEGNSIEQVRFIKI